MVRDSILVRTSGAIHLSGPKSLMVFRSESATRVIPKSLTRTIPLALSICTAASVVAAVSPPHMLPSDRGRRSTHQDVSCSEVAVNEALLVEVEDAGGDADHDAQGQLPLQRARLSPQEVPQGPTCEGR
jgi:hypothetical protein